MIIRKTSFIKHLQEYVVYFLIAFLELIKQ